LSSVAQEHWTSPLPMTSLKLTHFSHQQYGAKPLASKRTCASFNSMSSAEILDQLRALPVTERTQLVGQIWDEFADSELCLTPAQAAELDRRLEEHKRSPDDVVPWSEIKSATDQKYGRRP